MDTRFASPTLRTAAEYQALKQLQSRALTAVEYGDFDLASIIQRLARLYGIRFDKRLEKCGKDFVTRYSLSDESRAFADRLIREYEETRA